MSSTSVPHPPRRSSSPIRVQTVEWDRLIAAALVALAAVACSGDISRPGQTRRDRNDAQGSGAANGTSDRIGAGGKEMLEGSEGAGPIPVRRLTRREYDNTVADLLGDSSRPAQSFPRDAIDESGFATPTPASPLDAQLYAEKAEVLAAAAVKTFSNLHDCDVARTGDVACARTFVESFGRRAYRRPLVAEERASLEGLYARARELGHDHQGAISAVLQAMLQSPNFLYHWEVAPEPAERSGDIIKLDGYHIASRLSYFLWGTMPDDELFAAAESGELDRPEGVAEQARRLVADRTRLSGTVSDFHRQWLHIDVPSLQKDGKRFPDWSADLAAEIDQELDDLLEMAVIDGDASVETLFGTRATRVGPGVARLYGVDTTVARAVTLPAAERAGILTSVAFLATHAGADETHPVKRGQIVYRQILCGEIPAPPDDVPEAPPPDPSLSTRERFAMHAEQACAGCHKLFDPLGFAFESYDALGGYRAEDGGKPVDASGTAALPSGGNLGFTDAIDLSAKLAAHPEVSNCIARQWFRYAMGRKEVAADEPSISRLSALLGEGADLRRLWSALIASKPFTFRSTSKGELLP